jgi:hypothetical protein
MIYATMCIGNEWVSKYKDSINRFAKQNTLFVLTDNISVFENCNLIKYKRDVFSYYEKINLITHLLKNHKERITYIDSDWLQYYNTKIEFNDDSIYTYEIFDLKNPPLSDYFKETEYTIISKILSKVGVSIEGWYIPEAIISFPYHLELENIISDFNKLQTPLEEMYNTIPIREAVQRYSETGIGYGEGWAITAIASKYNIKVRDFVQFPNNSWRKIGLI